MDMLPYIAFNKTLNAAVKVVAQDLLIGGQIRMRKEIGRQSKDEAIVIAAETIKELKNHDIILKLVWNDASKNITYTRDAMSIDNENCNYPKLLTEEWTCSMSRVRIPFNNVCDGKYDCSKDLLDLSDENNSFCKIEPSLGYVYAVICYVILGLSSFTSIQFYLKKRSTAPMLVHGRFLPLTQ